MEPGDKGYVRPREVYFPEHTYTGVCYVGPTAFVQDTTADSRPKVCRLFVSLVTPIPCGSDFIN